VGNVFWSVREPLAEIRQRLAKRWDAQRCTAAEFGIHAESA
jgi:hypothetical protein